MAPTRAATRAAGRPPVVWTYKLGHDWGFAPNPFHGVCTLACCKSSIRGPAQVGDYVFGVGGQRSKRLNRAIFWMRVDEILTFDEYWTSEHFLAKRPVPNGFIKWRVGDNIYHRDPKTKEFLQEHSFHSHSGGITNPKDLKADTAQTENVLVGRDFVYWGGDAPEVPEHLQRFICQNRDREKRTDEAEVAAFLAWIAPMKRGLRGRPTEWRYNNPKAYAAL